MRAARYLGVTVEYVESHGVELRNRALMAQGVEDALKWDRETERLKAIMGFR